MNRIKELKQVKWRELKPLQPDNAKIVFNYQAIENSLNKYGFAQPFFGWEYEGEVYTIDGHTRKEVLSNMQNVPETLPCVLVDAKDRKEAIEMLIEVYNQKHNPFDIEVLEEMIEVEELDVDIETINVKIETEEIEEDVEHKETVKELANMIAVSLTDEETEIWQKTKERIGKLKDKNAIFELIKYYSNETGIN